MTQITRPIAAAAAEPDQDPGKDHTPPDDKHSVPVSDGDAHMGAVEGDTPSDRPQQGNANADALDEQGLPKDTVAICEDVLGANADGTQG